MKIKHYIAGNAIIFPFWIVLFFVFWIQLVPQTESLIESLAFPILLLASSFPITKYLSENLLQKAMKEKKMLIFSFQFLVLSFLIGVIFVLYLYLFAYLEQRGVFPLSSYFNMDVPPYMHLVPISAGLLMNICICGVRFFQENIELKKTLIEYQLRTLQQQLTPHFMFNVLNHIYILMQSDVELASSLLIKYSDILRYQLYNGETQDVTLEHDIQFLKDFIAIEEVRWGDKLTVNCNWQIENPEKKIPSLLFITFIENAFKYVSKSNFEQGYININFKQSANVMTLEVENSKSLIQHKKRADSSGLGLRNIRQRLEILYYGKYDLHISETGSVYYTKLTINT